jgi:predicted metal-binding protein
MNSGLVLVCERCFKERIPEEDPDKAAQIGDFHLRDWLKKRLKDDGHWGKVRAISTSCMDVCARRRVTVVIDPKTEGKTAQAYVVDPVADKEALYNLIVRELGETRDDRTTMDGPASGFERYEDEVTGR